MKVTISPKGIAAVEKHGGDLSRVILGLLKENSYITIDKCYYKEEYAKVESCSTIVELIPYTDISSMDINSLALVVRSDDFSSKSNIFITFNREYVLLKGDYIKIEDLL